MLAYDTEGTREGVGSWTGPMSRGPKQLAKTLAPQNYNLQPLSRRYMTLSQHNYIYRSFPVILMFPMLHRTQAGRQVCF